MTRSPAFERYARDGALVLGGVRRSCCRSLIRWSGAGSPRTARSPTTRCGGFGTRRVRLHDRPGRHGAGAPGGGVRRPGARRGGRSDRSGPAVCGWPRPCTASASILYELPARDARGGLADEIYAASATRHGAAGSRGGGPPTGPPSNIIGGMPLRASRSATTRESVARDLLHPRHVPLWVRAGDAARPHPNRGLLPDGSATRTGLPWRPRRFPRAVASPGSRPSLRRALRSFPSRRLVGGGLSLGRHDAPTPRHRLHRVPRRRRRPRPSDF